MSRKRLVYPFSAIVGQERMKTALLLNAINPKIGGALLRGEKGTAKSLAVRALAQLLPEVTVVVGCSYHCDPDQPEALCDPCTAAQSAGQPFQRAAVPVPVVELPLGATEDRVVGTLDIERAIKTGEKHFDPGILAVANRGILYIDEVNLLDDHLVDVLLDAAAMGVNFVEREGISFSHPAQFILVGTMNPEEGELRPQLLDRFALSVDVTGIQDKSARAEVVRRRIGFESDPEAFAATWAEEQERLRGIIARAMELLPQVQLSEAMLELITHICVDFGVDGHRSDIVMHKTARSLAAYHGRGVVTEEDVREAAELTLAHRRRRQPFEDPGLNEQQLQQSVQNWRDQQPEQPQDSSDPQDDDDPPPGDPPPADLRPEEDQPLPEDRPDGVDKETVFEADEPYKVRLLSAQPPDQAQRKAVGRRSKSATSSRTGRYVRSTVPRGAVSDLAFDATLRAAAPQQLRRRNGGESATALLIERSDLREKVRQAKVGNLILLVLDASGSMAAEERMKAAKGAVLSLLIDAYQRRDRVGLIAFRGQRAEVVLPPTGSVELARKHLAQLPTGGRTPLSHGLRLGLETIKKQWQVDRSSVPLLVLISDGKANVALRGGDPVEESKQVAREIRAAGIRSVAIDIERGFVTFGLVRRIAAEMGAAYLRLQQLQANVLVNAIKQREVQA